MENSPSFSSSFLISMVGESIGGQVKYRSFSQGAPTTGADIRPFDLSSEPSPKGSILLRHFESPGGILRLSATGSPPLTPGKIR
jgi:hypothetical protein